MSEPDDPPRVAVALKYDAPDAPYVVATGRGHVAEAILRAAAEAGIPIEHDPLLAQALSGLELDDRIPEDLYRAVAAVVAAILDAAEKAA